MSIQAIALVLDLELADVSAKAVLIGLANHTSPDGECFPSVKRLMRYSGLSERAVRETIKRLEEMSLITVVREPGKRSTYTLTLPPAAVAVPPLQQMQDPPAANAGHNRKTNRQNNTSDARASLADDWQPSPELQAKLDQAYPTIDINEQRKAFILSCRANGKAIIHPDAAFEMWMMRVPSLKIPAKSRPQASTAGRDPRDPAVLAFRAEEDARFKRKLGQWEDSSELWLEAARLWIGLHNRQDDAARCAATARSVAKAGSWAEEQANDFIARHWGEGFTGEPDNGELC